MMYVEEADDERRGPPSNRSAAAATSHHHSHQQNQSRRHMSRQASAAHSRGHAPPQRWSSSHSSQQHPQGLHHSQGSVFNARAFGHPAVAGSMASIAMSTAGESIMQSPDAMHPGPAIQSGFHFRRRKEKLNWRLLASVSVEKIVSEINIEVLQELLENVTFCDIDGEDLRNADPNIIKLFRISQLIIEFLLHSQDFLTARKDQLETQANESQRHLSAEIEASSQLKAELAAVKKENRSLRKAVYAYQLMSKMPGFNSAQPVPVQYHRCPYCEKAFYAQQYLDSHLQRRHGMSPTEPAHSKSKDEDTVEKFASKIADTEKQLKGEMESKLVSEIASRQETLEAAYKNERMRMENEMSLLKNQLQEERRLLENERQNMKAASNVGKIESVDDEENLEDDPYLKRLEMIESRQDESLNTIRRLLEKELKVVRQNSQSEEAERLAKLEEDRKKISLELGRIQKALSKRDGEENRTREAAAAAAAAAATAAAAEANRSSAKKKKNHDAAKEPIAETKQELPHVENEAEDDYVDRGWIRAPISLEPTRPLKYAPIPKVPEIRSRFLHTSDLIEKEKLAGINEMEESLKRRGITLEVVASETEVEKINKVFEKEKQLMSQSDPDRPRMVAVINKELAEISDKRFKFVYEPFLLAHKENRTNAAPLMSSPRSKESTSNAKPPLAGAPLGLAAESTRLAREVHGSRSSLRSFNSRDSLVNPPTRKAGLTSSLNSMNDLSASISGSRDIVDRALKMERELDDKAAEEDESSDSGTESDSDAGTPLKKEIKSPTHAAAAVAAPLPAALSPKGAFADAKRVLSPSASAQNAPKQREIDLSEEDDDDQDDEDQSKTIADDESDMQSTMTQETHKEKQQESGDDEPERGRRLSFTGKRSFSFRRSASGRDSDTASMESPSRKSINASAATFFKNALENLKGSSIAERFKSATTSSSKADSSKSAAKDFKSADKGKSTAADADGKDHHDETKTGGLRNSLRNLGRKFVSNDSILGMRSKSSSLQSDSQNQLLRRSQTLDGRATSSRDSLNVNKPLPMASEAAKKSTGSFHNLSQKSDGSSTKGKQSASMTSINRTKSTPASSKFESKQPKKRDNDGEDDENVEDEDDTEDAEEDVDDEDDAEYDKDDVSEEENLGNRKSNPRKEPARSSSAPAQPQLVPAQKGSAASTSVSQPSPSGHVGSSQKRQNREDDSRGEQLDSESEDSNNFDDDSEEDLNFESLKQQGISSNKAAPGNQYRAPTSSVAATAAKVSMSASSTPIKATPVNSSSTNMRRPASFDDSEEDEDEDDEEVEEKDDDDDDEEEPTPRHPSRGSKPTTAAPAALQAASAQRVTTAPVSIRKANSFDFDSEEVSDDDLDGHLTTPSKKGNAAQVATKPASLVTAAAVTRGNGNTKSNGVGSLDSLSDFDAASDSDGDDHHQDRRGISHSNPAAANNSKKVVHQIPVQQKLTAAAAQRYGKSGAIGKSLDDFDEDDDIDALLDGEY